MKDEPGRDVVVFIEALKLPIQERGTFLERVCAGDENLRQKVKRYCERTLPNRMRLARQLRR